MNAILLIALALAVAVLCHKRKRRRPNVRVTEKTTECKAGGNPGSVIMANPTEHHGPNRPPLIIPDSDYDSFITVYNN